MMVEHWARRVGKRLLAACCVAALFVAVAASQGWGKTVVTPKITGSESATASIAPTTTCPGAPLPAGPLSAAIPGQARSQGPAHGTLLIVGGGTNGPAVRQAAYELSGGAAARWVLIPTAAEDAEIPALSQQNIISRLGLPFTVLHARDRAEADSEAFVAPLKNATAVWFDGGRQWRLVDAYAGTRTERELRAVLDRGGVIAGSSAGATIQGSYLVRGSPTNNSVLMSPGHEQGFGYIANVAIDQHVLVRHRECDLARLVARRPELLGIAIDEGTGLVVRGNTATVIGASSVLITDGVEHGKVPFYALAPGDRFDLATWTTLPPGE